MTVSLEFLGGAHTVTGSSYLVRTSRAAHDQISQFILHSGVFDSTADFFGATRDPDDADPLTTVLIPKFATHSDPDGTPDFLHLGRAGAQAEGEQLDVQFFAPARQRR